MAKRVTSPLERHRALTLMLLTVGASSILAGCVRETPDQIRQADEQRCVSRGFQPSTPSFAACAQLVHRQVGQAAGPWWGPPFGSGDW